MKKSILLLGVLTAVSIPTLAGDLYLIGNTGQTSFADDSTKVGVGLGLGYELSSNIALEFDYRHLGSFEDKYYSSKYGNTTENTDFSSAQLSAIFKLPLSENFDLFGRIGTSTLTTDVTLYDNLGKDSSSDNLNKTIYGFGGDLRIDDNLKVRAEYLEWQDTKLKTVSVGITYSF
jgi:OmpA-OmpF porin, OOP family